MAYKYDDVLNRRMLEMILIGAIMRSEHGVDPDAAARAKRILDAGVDGECFRDPSYGAAFESLAEAFRRSGRPPTPEEGKMRAYENPDNDDPNDAINYEHFLVACKAAFEVRKVDVDATISLLLARRPAPRAWGLDEFPTWALPPAAGGIVDSLSCSAQVDWAMPGMAALGILSALVARAGWRCELWRGFIETPNLYVMCAAAPSEHKSSVLKPLMYEVRRIERDTVEAWKTERSTMTARVAELESQRDKERKAGNHVKVGEVTAELLKLKESLKRYPALTLDDCTPEALARALEHNGCVLFSSAEAQVVSNICSPYSREQQLSIYLKSWSGDATKIDRRGCEEPTILDEPLLAMALLVQPEALRSMAANVKGAREFGLISRFLVAMPRSLVGRRGTGADLRGEDAWNALVRRLHREPGRMLRLSAGATTLLENWRATLEREIRPGGKFASISDWIGKLQVGQVVRIATILHAAWGLAGDEIQGPCMKRALDLGAFFLSHAERAFEVFMGEDALEQVARKIIAAVDKPGIRDGFYKSNVASKHNKSLKREPLFDDAWTMLAAAGVVEHVKGDEKKWRYTGKDLPVRESTLPTGIAPKPPRPDDEMLALVAPTTPAPGEAAVEQPSPLPKPPTQSKTVNVEPAEPPAAIDAPETETKNDEPQYDF